MPGPVQAEDAAAADRDCWETAWVRGQGQSSAGECAAAAEAKADADEEKEQVVKTDDSQFRPLLLPVVRVLVVVEVAARPGPE